ncbi:uncharacterized protein LOC124163305 [Ischnura elegans]|uniref:uncharacterized protein LOC124163305 n=1 Tax=Ischnura elegans TaxID=197161 RepID=UPI001ED8B069|nr:uncharacterized protein LOC124163305 [Ischnura elegans]
MGMSVHPVKLGFDVPPVAHRHPLGFAERLDGMISDGSPSLAARGAASAGLVFGGGTLAVLLLLLAMAGLSDAQTVFQARPTSLFPRDSLKKMSGKPLATAKTIGRPPMVYHSGQTVAVVALGPGKTLLDCELIETYNPGEKEVVLDRLAKSRLRSLEVTFSQMMELMRGCHNLAEIQGSQETMARGPRKLESGDSIGLQGEMTTRSVSGANAFTLLQGIMPGTKWCGTGDIAETYYDLGPEADLDMCCRTHDLCPAKIRAFTSRYNLTNFSIYSKSHCECDEMFYKCLKRTGNQNAMIIGNFYFNLLRVPCIGEAKGKGDAANTYEMEFRNNMQTF